MRTDEIKSEIDEIKKWEGKIKRKDLKYETGKYKYDFQKYETIRSIDESIYSGKISIHKADIDQINMKIGNDKSRLKTEECRDKKRNTFDSVSALYEGQQLTLDSFESGIFQ